MVLIEENICCYTSVSSRIKICFILSKIPRGKKRPCISWRNTHKWRPIALLFNLTAHGHIILSLISPWDLNKHALVVCWLLYLVLANREAH